jgi:nicotinate-nucleotide adenylyltransferase
MMQKLAIFGGTFNPVHNGHLQMAKTALVQFALDAVVWVPTYHPVYKSADGLAAFSHRLAMVERAIAPYPGFVGSSIETIEHLDFENLHHELTPGIPSEITSESTPKFASEFASTNSSDISQHRFDRTNPDRTYAVNTFAALRAQYPQTKWYWLIGVDAFQSLPRWYHHQNLAPHCHWLVAPRLRTEILPTEWTLSEKPQASPITARQICQQVCEHVAEILAKEDISLQWSLLEMPLVEISSSRIRQDCRDRRSICHLVPPDVQAYILEQGLYLNRS